MPHAPGQQESDDALVIHLPQEGCVVAGDTVMTGSFPMFGQPVMNEGLMGTSAWLETLQAIERLQPVHVLPGHGPVAHEQEFMLLERLERYFLEEVAARVARGMLLPAPSPIWKVSSRSGSRLFRWCGAPRYAILRVYRGLVDDPADEPGWQHYKPSAIPAGDQARVQAACATLADLRAFQEVAKEYEEGGDLGSAIAVARSATVWAPTEPAVWVFLAECLVRSAEACRERVRKGDFL